MAEELFDILDENRRVIGTASRAEAHALGLWHQTFQCWVWSRGADGIDLLFQLRHRDKDTFPGLLDISCAGHLHAGEASMDGVRELHEELGLEVAFAELMSCGVFAEQQYMDERLIDREFCHVFLYENNQPLSSYRMQADEVSGLYRIRLSDLRNLLEKGTELIAKGLLLNPDGSVSQHTRKVSESDLVPHPIEYFKLLFEKLSHV